MGMVTGGWGDDRGLCQRPNRSCRLAAPGGAGPSLSSARQLDLLPSYQLVTVEFLGFVSLDWHF